MDHTSKEVNFEQITISLTAGIFMTCMWTVFISVSVTAPPFPAEVFLGFLSLFRMHYFAVGDSR